MKRLNTLFTILTVGAVLTCTVFAGTAGAATPVKNVTLAKSGDFTEVTIPVPSHLLCDHFTEPATADRPFRIVLNLCNAEHAMPQQNYSNLPVCMVQKIRTSQFAATPEPIVRVVLDLKSSATYTVRTEDDRLVVAIADASPAFATWQANQLQPAVMAKTEAAPKQEMAAKPSQPAMMAKTETTPKPIAAKPAGTSTVKDESTNRPTQPDMIAKADMSPKPVAAKTATTPKTETAAKKETPAKPAAPMMAQVTTKPETKSEAPAKKTEKSQIVPPVSASSEPVVATPTQSLALEPTKTNIDKKDMPTTTPSTVAMSSDELVGPNATHQNSNESSMPAVSMMEPEPSVATMQQAPVETFTFPEQPLVYSPEYLDAVNAGKVTMGAPLTAQNQPATMPAYNGGTTPQVATNNNESPMLAAVSTPTNDVTLPATVSSSDTLTGQEALIDRLKAKFFSGARAPKAYLTDEGIIEEMKNADGSSFGPPTPGADMDREALLARIREAALKNEQNVPANMLPSVPGGPARTEVFYDDEGRRDPFEPLLKGLRSGFLSDDLPSVESLRMVGVLKDKDQALALMEDTDGHSYIMRPGDAVNNGHVLSVGEQRTVIQVDEYGWTRTVVLQLTSRGSDPSKSLGAKSNSGEEEAAPRMPE